MYVGTHVVNINLFCCSLILQLFSLIVLYSAELVVCACACVCAHGGCCELMYRCLIERLKVVWWRLTLLYRTAMCACTSDVIENIIITMTTLHHHRADGGKMFRVKRVNTLKFVSKIVCNWASNCVIVIITISRKPFN